eukprot:3351373-Pleurochrysis_carterae.AAC.1
MRGHSNVRLFPRHAVSRIAPSRCPDDRRARRATVCRWCSSAPAAQWRRRPTGRAAQARSESSAVHRSPASDRRARGRRRSMNERYPSIRNAPPPCDKPP